MAYSSLDPMTTQPSYKNKLIAALTGSGEQPGQDWSGANLPGTPATPPPQTTGSTTQPTKAELPSGQSNSTAGGEYDTSGLDPNNPIDAIFLKNKYKQGGQGSGFGDLAYWRAHPDQAARLDADQRGVGTDMPGPGDVGNTSFDPNAGRGGQMMAGGTDLGGLLGGAASGLLGSMGGLSDTNSFLSQLLARLQGR